MTTQFGDKYRAWARITKATMRIHHKPGDAMQVDWAGDTLPIYDSETGEIIPAYLFIAVLPCSCYVLTVEGCSLILCAFIRYLTEHYLILRIFQIHVRSLFCFIEQRQLFRFISRPAETSVIQSLVQQQESVSLPNQ